MEGITQKFKIICRKCGLEGKIAFKEGNGCSDPECCGGPGQPHLGVRCECGEYGYEYC